MERVLYEEEIAIRELDQKLAAGDIKTKKMLQFINKFENPVKFKEDEKSIIEKMTVEIDEEIYLYKGYNES